MGSNCVAARRFHPAESSGEGPSSGDRYNLTLLVVQVATPVPKKSASSVQTGQSNNNAQARAGQSSASRSPMRARARCSNERYRSESSGRTAVSSASSVARAATPSTPRFSNNPGRYLRASSKAASGAKKTYVSQRLHDQLAHTLPQNGADQDVRIKDDCALHHMVTRASTGRLSCSAALCPPCARP